MLDSTSPKLPAILSEPISYFLDQPSKKIRPLISIFCCDVVGGNIDEVIPAATAIELFHDFTLIHDDIMDQDELRRGKPTIHVKWDAGTAILVGDALIGLSFQQLVRSPTQYLNQVVKIFSEALVTVCEGQALDKSFESLAEIGVEDYLDMIGKKTAWLFKASCEIGSIIGGANRAQVESLSQYGYNLGMAFQIQDDLLDFVADENLLGKKVGSDFKMDKKTYITLKYHERLNQDRELQKRYPGHETDFISFADYQQALKDLGIIDEVETAANAYFEKSLQRLREVSAAQDHSLYRLTDFLYHRQY